MGAQVEKGRGWGRGFSPSLGRRLQGGQPGGPDGLPAPAGSAAPGAGGDVLLPYLAVAEHVGGRREAGGAAGIAAYVSSEMKAAEASASEGLQGRSAPSK